MSRSFWAGAAWLVLSGLAFGQAQIVVASANMRSAELAGTDPPPGLTYTQAAAANDFGSAPIANNNAIVVGFTLPAAAGNLSISAYVTSGAIVTAYLTTTVGGSTNADQQKATTTFSGSSNTTHTPTVIFTNLSLAAGNYYLTLTSSVSSTAPNVPMWGTVTSGGPQIVDAAGGFTGVYQGVAGTVAAYPPASTFTPGGVSRFGFMFDVDEALPGVLPVATAGTPYSTNMTAAGGAGSYTWSLPTTQTGPPPAWILIDPGTGTLSGTPPANGTYSFQVDATDSQSNTGTLNVSLLVNFANTVITGNLPSGMAILNLSATPGATAGGNGASNSLNSNTGTQTQWSGPFNTANQFLEYTLQPGTYTMRLIDTADAAATFPALTQPQLNAMWTAWTSSATWQTDYLAFDSIAATNSQSQIFSGGAGSGAASNAVTAYANVINGSLESNLAFQYTNAAPQKTVTIPVQGTGAETLLFAVPAGSLKNNPGGISILIAPATSAPSFVTASVPAAQVGAPYNGTGFPMQAVGGSGIYQWSAAGLPQGMSISYSGLLVGTPTVHNSTGFSVTFTVEDPVSGLTASSTLPLALNAPPPSLVTTSIPAAQVGAVYSGFQMQAAGGSGSYQWSASGLPHGVSISLSGLITGTPTAYSNTGFSVTFTVQDSVSALTAASTLSLTMNPASPALNISTTSIPQGEINVAYSTQISASGGFGALTYQLVNNTSPLAINSTTGVVSSNGVPVTEGNSTHFQVQVTDAAGETGTSGTYTLVLDSAIVIASPNFGLAAVGESWVAQLTATGGSPIRTSWTTIGAPGWLRIDNSGVLSGTPTATGVFSFQARVTDSLGGTYTANLSLTVTMPVSYLVVNSSNGGGVTTASLQEVAGDGSTVSTLSSGALVNATDMVLDGYGNAVLANGSSLVRAIPLGSNVSAFATAPSGSQWVAAAVDKSGNFIVADNKTHEIWRVSADGLTAVSVANYPVATPSANEHVKVAVLPNGNYFVVMDNVNADAPVGMFSITPAGVVTPITLSGTLAYGVGGMTPDGNGGYVLLDAPNNRLIDFTTAGAGTSIAAVNNVAAPLGIARNPLTNDLIAGFQGGLTKVTSTGSSVTALVTNANLGYPLAIVALPLDFPSAVASTNPLSYFRLENSTGASEVKGTYTYAYTGGVTTSNSSEPPISIPANNYAVLDGSTGAITTTLSGGIATAGSMMAWVNLAALPSTSPYSFNYIAGESAQANDFDLQFSNTNILGFYTTCCGASLNYTPNPSTLAGQWHMIAVSFDAVAGSRAIYWDGLQVASDNCPQCASYENKTGTFWIGNTFLHSSSGNRFFNGSIDEVAVWNYALSPAQVYQMYASRPPASAVFPVSLTPSPIAARSSDTPISIALANSPPNCSNQCPSLLVVAPSGAGNYTMTPAITAAGASATIPAAALATPGIAEVALVSATGVPSNALPLTILAPLAIAPMNTVLPGATVTQLYSQQLTAMGGSGNYFWSIESQSSGLNLSLSLATGATVTLTGTPLSPSTGDPSSIVIQLTDTLTNANSIIFYQIAVARAPGPPAGTQPVNTTAYVLSEDGSIYSVTNGTPTQVVGARGLSASDQAPGSWLFNNGLTHGEHSVIHGGTFYGPLDARGTSFTNSGVMIANPASGAVSNIFTGATIPNLQSGCVEAAPAFDNAGFMWLHVCSAANNGFIGLVRVDPVAGTSTLSIDMRAYGSSVNDYEAVGYDPVNNLVFESAATTLYAFNATTGAFVWSTPGSGGSGTQEMAPMLVEGANVYWKSPDGGTHRINTATGVNQASSSAPVVGDNDSSYAQIIYDPARNYVLVTSNDNGAFILNGTSLATVSSYGVDTGYCFNRGGAFNPNSGVWFVTARQCNAPYSSKVYALSTTGGSLSLLWTNTTALDNQWEISSILADNNYVYAGVQAVAPYNTTGNGYILAIDVSTGELFRTFNLVHSVASSSPSVYGGKLIVGLWDTFGYQAIQLTGGGATRDFLYKADANMSGFVGPWTNSLCETCTESDLGRDGSGNLIVAEGQDVTAYTPAGAPVAGYPIAAGTGSRYQSVAIDSTGSLLIADSGLDQLIKVNAGVSRAIASFTGNGDAFVRVDPQGNYIVVTDTLQGEGAPAGISIFKISPNGNTVTPIAVTPDSNTAAPLSVGGFTFDAAGNYVITDWSRRAVYTITPSGTSTPLFTDPHGYFIDLLGISWDRVGGSLFLVDDQIGSLSDLSSDGSTINQISNSVGQPSAVFVADTVSGAPLTFTPAQGTLTAGFTGVPYTLPLTASGGSGSYFWQIVNQSSGLNLALTGSSGANVSLTGTPRASNTGSGLTIELQLTDSVTQLTVQKTYTIPVDASALWTAAGSFDDGGALSGSFNFGSGAVNVWSIDTSAGSKLTSPFAFTPSNSTAHYYSAGNGGCATPCIVFTSNQQFPAANGNQPRILTLAFNDVPDHDFGGAVSLNTSHTGGSSECLQCSPVRYLTAGSVSSGTPISPQPSGTIAYLLEENGEVDAAAGGLVAQLSPGTECSCLDFAVDSSGNFIIAGGSTILGMSPNGAPLPHFSPAIPEGGYLGSVAIDSGGNYIVADEAHSQILRYAAPTTNNPSPQPTVVATLPAGVDGDILVRIDSSGNYIVLADNANTDDGPSQLFLFSITPAGATTSIPVTTPPGIVGPLATCGMTFDANGNYVDVDCYNEEIYSIAKAGAVNQGTVSVLYGNPDGYLSDPLGITRDPHTGNFFVTDGENNALYSFAPDGSNFSQVLSGGFLSSSPSSVFIVDTTPPTTTNYGLQKDGTLMGTVGGATLSCGANCGGNAMDLAIDASGNFIIAALQNLVKLTPTGVSSVIATNNSGQWVSVAVDSFGNYIVADNTQHQLQVISPAGTVTKSIPYNVAVANQTEHVYVRIDSNGNYIVAEDNGGDGPSLSRIYKIAPSGTVTMLTIVNSPISTVSGLTFDANGNYVVVSSTNNAIYVLTPGNGNNLTSAVLSNSASLDNPSGISRDPVSGNYLVGTNVPDGLASLSPDGTQLTILLNNVANPVGTASVTFGVATPSLAAGAQGQTYGSVNLAGVGGSGNYTWSATGLPDGMALSATGILSGTPTNSGNFQVQITLTDTDGHSSMTTLPLSVTSGTVTPPPPVTPPLSITSGSVAGGTVGVSYGPVSMSASGGSGSYTWSMIGAPPGLGISSAGFISGTPTAPGNFTVSISVISASLFAQRSYTIAIAPAPVTISGPNNLGGFAPSGAVSASYTANGGQSPYKWSATNLPTGLTLNGSTGALTGSVALPGNYSFSVQATDSQSLATSVGVTMYVLGIGTSKLPDGTNHVAYSQSLSAIGGPGPYTWTTSGSLPPGLSLSPSGVISGTPSFPPPLSTLQTFILGVSLTEGNLTVDGIISITITISPEKLSIPGSNPDALPDASLNVGYSQSLTAAGGAPSYTWSVLAGTLPPGVGLSSSGTLSGTPTSASSFGFTAQVKDTSGGTASSGFTINVAPPAFTITTGSPLSNAIAGSAYPAQSFAAKGGIGPYTFAITSGSLPAGLSMSDGTITGTPSAVGSSSFTITATDSSVPALTATAEYQISVAQPHTDLVLSSTSLSFSLQAGATAISGSGVVTVGSSGTQSLGYSLSVTPPASWLDVTGGGSTPDDIVIALDPKASALSAGSVTTSIAVTCVTPPAASAPSPCAGNTQSIGVSLNVVSAPPLLSVGPGLLSFSGLTASPGSTTQSLIVRNNGGGTITVNSVTSPDQFVSAGSVPASIAAGASASVAITVNTSGVAAGYYQSSLLVDTSAGSATIPLTLLVAANATMALAPSGTQFQMVAGASPGNPNGSFTVAVNTTSAVNWHAAVLPGASWLTLSTASVSSTSATPGKVFYTIDSTAAAALTAGTYYGTIEVASGGIVNSPQDFLVVLNVNASPDLLQPDPEPAGLIFIANGSAAVPPQTVNVYSGSSSPLAFLASVSSSDTWLSVSVSGSGTAGVGAAGSSLVSVNIAGLSAGVYRGTVSYQFTGAGASAGVRSVNVTLIVAPSGTIPSARNGNAQPGVLKPMQQTSGCAPSQLVPTQTGLVNAFSQPASWPTPLNILLTDDCGNPQPKGQVVVTFSNGDAPLELSPVDTASGNFAATWTPRNAANQITIAAQGTASGFAPAVAQISGAVTPKATPVLTPNGTLNVFAPVVGAPIAPGTIVQIYGSNLSGQPGAATNIPLPTKLNSTQVLIGGRLAPLYYVSSGQINAQVPFELNAGQTYQLIVNANGALSTPNPIQLSLVAPGIAGFTDGEVIAQHLDGSLVTDDSPAVPNEIVVFYVAGMGQTNQNVGTGDASPSANLATPLAAPSLTVGGIPVTNILFAGLTPTLVGLYQVDFQVPATTPAGDQPLVLTQSGQGGQSNTTVLPVGVAPPQ